MRSKRPFLFTNLKTGLGLEDVARFVLTAGGFEDKPDDASRHSAGANSQ